MKQVYICGAGMVKFGRHEDRTIESLAVEAISGALISSAVSIDNLNCAFFGHSNQGRVAGQRVMRDIGYTGIPIFNIENACTGGASAFHQAFITVASGFHDVALVVGMEKMQRGLIKLNPGDIEARIGRTMPAKYALRATRHKHQYGLTDQQLALVSVKNRYNGSLNTYAHFQQSVTMEEVLESRMIAEPITLMQCCPTSDGAAAVVICNEDSPLRRGKAVKVLSSVVVSGKYCSISEKLSSDDELAARAGYEAYKLARVNPADIDIAEVHDAFTIGEILAYENLGFCLRGEGGRMIEERHTTLKGKLPVNTSGGRLSLGHPLGATGVAQLCEIYWQLTKQAGGRQVEDATLGLAQCVGGSVTGIGAASCAVHILSS